MILGLYQINISLLDLIIIYCGLLFFLSGNLKNLNPKRDIDRSAPRTSAISRGRTTSADVALNNGGLTHIGSDGHRQRNSLHVLSNERVCISGVADEFGRKRSASVSEGDFTPPNFG